VTLLSDVDDLYEVSVTDPTSLNDQAVSAWAESVASSHEVDRVAAKYVRRCLGMSRRLAAFWAVRPQTADDPTDWRSRVDIAFGIRAWRPQLDLAQHLLAAAPTNDTFHHVTELFRLVNGTPFLDGVSYEEWYETQQK